MLLKQQLKGLSIQCESIMAAQLKKLQVQDNMITMQTQRLAAVAQVVVKVNKASKDRLQRQTTKFEAHEDELKKTISKLEQTLETVQGQLRQSEILHEEAQAESESIRKELEDSKERTREDVTALRKDLREQLMYTQAIESEKKQHLTEIDALNSRLNEVKDECTSTLGVKERVFKEQTLQLRQQVEELEAQKIGEVEKLNS